MNSSSALLFHIPRELPRSLREHENSIFTDETESLPLQSCRQIVRKTACGQYFHFPIPVLTRRPYSETPSRQLHLSPLPTSSQRLSSQVLSQRFKCTLFTKEVSELRIPNHPINWGALRSVVPSWDSELEQVDKVLG